MITSYVGIGMQTWECNKQLKQIGSRWGVDQWCLAHNTVPGSPQHVVKGF
jgi:hypothetical protein